MIYPRMRYRAILLPGIVTPAEIAYSPLRESLGRPGEVLLRDLAVYNTDEPPPRHRLESEIASVLATADSAGLERFHLMGFSAGGAVAAAFAAAHGERLASLCLLEPAWLGNADQTEEELLIRKREAAAADLPLEQSMAEFIKLNLADGVAPPPPPEGPPPPWMANRPAAIRVITEAFDHHELDTDALRRLACPVLYVLCEFSNPVVYARPAERARSLFADFSLVTFKERHHFDPPHRAEPARFAGMIGDFWQRAEDRAVD